MVGGAKWWIAAAYVLGLAIAVAALYVASPISEQLPQPLLGTVEAPHPGPILRPGAAQTLTPDGSGDPVVYLASLGGIPDEILVDLADHVHSKYDIVVRVLRPSSPETSAFDPERDQYITEALVGGLARTYPRADPEDQSVVIGVLADDIYILDRTDWAWAFGMRSDNGYAVVSTARMGSLQEPIAPIVLSRLRKMIVRDIGVLYYGLPLNDDPRSVLYVDVLGVDDLDRMSEELCGSECPSQALVGTTAPRGFHGA
jgi:predicted Zn-dependent protease